MTDRDAVRAFRRHTAPDPAAAERIRAAVLHRRPRRRLLPAAAVLAAAAAAVVFLRPPPPISGALTAAAPSTRSLSADVHADFVGEGHFAGTEAAPQIDWTSGRLTLDVAPRQGIDLTVRTDEALVEVVGTVFTVERDSLGTTVSVSRGRVIVTCTEDRTPHLLTDAQQRTCQPTDLLGLLRRASALRDAGAAPEVILATVDRALATPGQTPPLTAELTWLRLTLLTRLGRYDDAAREAAVFVASDPPVHGTEAAEMLQQLESAGFGG